MLMKQTLENKQKVVFYLLGELSGAERDAMEERLFLDEDFSLFLDSVENDLIDEYIRGELDASEKVKFENSYLKSETRREKIRTAQILQARLFDETQKTQIVTTEPKVSFWQSLTDFFRLPNFALASGLAVILLFLLGTIWFTTGDDIDKNTVQIIENTNQPDVSPPPNTPENVPVNNQSNTNKTLENNKNLKSNKNSVDSNAINGNSNKDNIEPKKPETEKIPPDQAPQPPRVFAFTLVPPIRSGERPTLIVPSDAQTIRLRVEHNNSREFIKYRAEIRDSSGDLIWSREIAVSPKTLQKPLVLDVRSNALITGSYELTLSGVTSDAQLEEVNFYNFTVRRK